MKRNSNIFCASNPAKLLDALWEIIKTDSHSLENLLIFLPSRRVVRSVEKMIVQKIGNAALLPQLVALGEGDPDSEPDSDTNSLDIISNTERVLILAKLLSADPNIRTISNALPIARDLVRMQDYIENEVGANNHSSDIDWLSLVDEKYAEHFQKKAEFLNLVTSILPTLYNGRITSSQKRNSDIRGWISSLSALRSPLSKIIVCGSTASVPATADLMEYIAGLENGYIILPGKISGRDIDFELDTNPYNSEYKFLNKIGVSTVDITVIDVGSSDIDFFNMAFGNTGGRAATSCNAQLIECAREAEEAEVVAEIASRAVATNKTVLVITPDAAGNQRIATALARRNISADFSGGTSGTMTNIGRAILNLFDDWMESRSNIFDTEYKKNNHNLFETLVNVIELNSDQMTPKFQIDDATGEIWDALRNVSDALSRNGIILDLPDARAIIADALSGVSIRPPMNDGASVYVLGTIESRMQTADIVILTGLNEGMFPSRGYENAWIPRPLGAKIGLPSPDRKVSLMALDFMNLSCCENVYWTRSRTAGGNQTTESRFLSRISVISAISYQLSDILTSVRARDNVPYAPLDYSPPRPPADRSDVYVTELELLIHNPYAFYVRHILRLRVKDDYWKEPDARDFGNLVHKVIEDVGANNYSPNPDQLIADMDKKAREILEPGSVIFHFWHKRFVEIAPAIVAMLKDSAGGKSEIKIQTNIAGRNVRAIADRVWDNHVLDIKTGAAPNKSQLESGNMPQLPLEAYMLEHRALRPEHRLSGITMQFLQLQNNNVRLIEYTGEIAQNMIDASVQKVSELFGRYSNDFEPYEYYETSDAKYQAYDDLARVND